MSPNVGNFVHDLVEMAKAMEALPLVQAERDRANDMVEAYAKQVQSLELRLIDRKNEIDSLNSTIHAVEAERDDAELRFLESVDRTASALAFIKSTFGSAGSLIQALEPPAPAPVVVPVDAPVALSELKAIDNPLYGDPTQADAPQGQSEPLPSVAEGSSDNGNDVISPTVSQTESAFQPTTTEYSTAEAVSVPSDPTATETTDLSHAATTSHAEQGISADTTTQPDPVPTDRGPYHGRRWSEVSPKVGSIGDWVDGGGARDDYWL